MSRKSKKIDESCYLRTYDCEPGKQYKVFTSLWIGFIFFYAFINVVSASLCMNCENLSTLMFELSLNTVEVMACTNKNQKLQSWQAGTHIDFLQVYIQQARRRLLKGRYNEFVNVHLMVLRQVIPKTPSRAENVFCINCMTGRQVDSLFRLDSLSALFLGRGLLVRCTLIAGCPAEAAGVVSEHPRSSNDSNFMVYQARSVSFLCLRDSLQMV